MTTKGDVKTQLLTAKNWRVSSDVIETTRNGVADAPYDKYANLAPCGKDDFIRFRDDMSMLVDEGPTKCAPNDPQTQGGKWSWNSGQTEITMTDPTFAGRDKYSGPVDLTTDTITIVLTDTKGTTVTKETIVYKGF
ncbi:hypothetical protein [Hymenobacter sp. BT491]|uniref:hypothetical protein n=1 Tax=Hymenobacter sp. BT491 TaxID=2766779 RepID=UPI001653849C|nr:hypothetical protein [Hymenobacter sp. BT491]MBC6991011.1 hypothetical protein [Hymenobacter sp. BT491]